MNASIKTNEIEPRAREYVPALDVADSSKTPFQRAVLNRLPELDSVRGLASLTVVFLHFHDMWMPDNAISLSPWARILLRLLKPIYAGNESVILFFLLSGIVLSFPYLSGRQQFYPKFALRRILRIYGPYLIALSLALLGASIWHSHSYHGLWASNMWAHPLNTTLILQHLAFIGVYNWSEYDFVIWSLVHEMRISLIFPILFWGIMRLSLLMSAILAIALSCVAFAVAPPLPNMSANYSLPLTLHYMVPFIAGILIARNLQQVREWWRTSSILTRRLTMVISTLCFVYDDSIVGVLGRLTKHYVHIGAAATTGMVIEMNYVALIGSIGLIIVALNEPVTRKFLNGKAAAFLGRISYSLYLTHPIVLLALTFACGRKISPWVQFPIYVSGALLVGWAFCVVVEEFFIRQMRKV